MVRSSSKNFVIIVEDSSTNFALQLRIFLIRIAYCAFEEAEVVTNNLSLFMTIIHLCGRAKVLQVDEFNDSSSVER